MSKMLVKKIGVVIGILVTILLMILTYKTWSKNGDYTIMSFISSFIIDGGIGFVMGYIVATIVNKLNK